MQDLRCVDSLPVPIACLRELAGEFVFCWSVLQPDGDQRVSHTGLKELVGQQATIGVHFRFLNGSLATSARRMDCIE